MRKICGVVFSHMMIVFLIYIIPASILFTVPTLMLKAVLDLGNRSVLFSRHASFSKATSRPCNSQPLSICRRRNNGAGEYYSLIR